MPTTEPHTPARTGAPRENKMRGLGLRLTLARLALLWEQLWPALWPATGLAGVYVALSLAGLWQAVPGWLHWAVFVAFIAAMIFLLGRLPARLKPVGEKQALARIEKASGLRHQPLSVLSDSLAVNRQDPGTQALWQLHVRSTAQAIGRLRGTWPKPGMARRDTLGLRAVVGMLLVIGFAAAGSQWQDRVLEGMTPDLTRRPAPPATVDAWITPPEYTGSPPIFLASADHPTGAVKGEKTDNSYQIPQGSELLVRVHGGGRAPNLRIGGADRELEVIDPLSYELTLELTLKDMESPFRTVELELGSRTLGLWRLEVLPDSPPSPRFAALPVITEQNALQLEYRVVDDYGVVEVEARLSRPEAISASSLLAARTAILPLPLPGTRIKDATETSYQDVTPHPWAGLEVDIRIAARDDLNQWGLSDPRRIKLPERDFFHPVARAIIAERRRLAVDPASRQDVAGALRELNRNPAAFGEDVTVGLNLADAAARLIYNQDDDAVDEVIDQLWDTALHLEDGGLSLAQREVRELQQALLDALARDAPQAEVQALLDRLENALDRYLQAMLDSAPVTSRQFPLSPQTRQIRADNLKRILDRIRELSATGARESARALLSRLQSILESLQRMPAMSAGNEAERALRNLQELGELADRQRQLLDQTFRQSQQPMLSLGEFDAQADRQETLRRALGDLMTGIGEMGDIPRALGRAERAMRDARQDLRRTDPRSATEQQARALEQLREGARDMVGDLMKKFGGGTQYGAGQPFPGGGPDGTDPLGRPAPYGSTAQNNRDAVPDEIGSRRAREILNELRRRASDLSRSQRERDYLNTLLRRF